MNLGEELKQAWNRPNNGLIQLIIINVVVFVLMVLLLVISKFSGADRIFEVIYNQFALPGSIEKFIYKPWTIITYAFTHSLSGILHILFNMLIFYWFGRVFVDYLGSQKLINLYVLGAIAGGVTFMLFANLAPISIISVGSTIVGASAAVYAIAVATATLVPDYTFYLLLIGPVRIKYLVAIAIFLSIMGSVGSNAGGAVSHLGGALIGWIYIKQLNSGNEMGKWVFYFMDWVKGIFKPKSKIKVSYKSDSFGKGKTKSSTSKKKSIAKDKVSQDEIDAILDKISEKGYESLSKEEKEKLFNASNK